MKRIDIAGASIYLLVAVAIFAPLLASGFIVTLDMIFVPHIPMPNSITSSYLFHAALHILSIVIPAHILEKIVLVSAMLLAAFGMHRLLRKLQPEGNMSMWGVVVASIFFAVNPFTYERYMAGQYAVLLGYALLPWLTNIMVQFGRAPSFGKSVRLGLIITLIGIVSIHTLADVTVLVAAAAAVALWHHRGAVRGYVQWGGVAAIITIVLSSYWLVPLLLGYGATSQTINSFTGADTSAFATTGANPAVRIFEMLRLEGFWAEAHNLFLLPQDVTKLWGLLALIIIAVVVYGTVRAWRRHPRLLLTLGGSAAIGLVLAAGVLGGWAAHVPLLAGLREPQKLVALVALYYAVSLAFGVNALAKIAREQGTIIWSISRIAFIAVPLLLTRVMLGGFGGQLVPRQYPAEWVTAKAQLDADPAAYQTLALPWHQYMSFAFAGRIIANPLPLYFERPMIVSTNPELSGASGGAQDAAQVAIGRLLAQKNSAAVAATLAQYHVKYVVVAKEMDWQTDNFVAHAPGMKKVFDQGAIEILANTDWRN